MKLKSSRRLALATVAALVGSASATTPAWAQTYHYTARTAAPVEASGAVEAAGLTWQCSATTCTISGPWATPGVSACAALAKKVGRITEYGHPGRKLSAEQLKTCNEGVAGDTPTLRSNPVLREQMRRKPSVPVRPKIEIKAPTARPAPVDPGVAEATGGPQLAIEEGSYQDYTLYVRDPEGVAFHGTYDGAYPEPTPDVPWLAWSGNTLRLPALSHTGSDESAEAVLPAGSVPADSVVDTTPSGRFVEIPLAFEEIPQRVSKIQVSCIFINVPDGTGVYVAGPFSAQNQIGFAEGDFWRREVTEGDWRLSAAARLPVNLRHFMTPADIHSVGCQARLFILRTTGRGVDQVLLERAADPGHGSYLPGMRSPSGASPNHKFRVNVEDPS